MRTIAKNRTKMAWTEKQQTNKWLAEQSSRAEITVRKRMKEQYNDPAIIIAKDNPSYSLFCLLAILNSKLATFYHFNHSPKATKGVFPKILVQDIKDFPIPIINENDKSIIENLVSTIQIVKNTDVKAEIAKEEQEIDFFVYKLYGLTYDDVKIVDPDTNITRDNTRTLYNYNHE